MAITSSQAVRELAGRFGDVHVLVVGDPILDEYVVGECTRLSPEAPIPVLRVGATRAVLGGAANTAANVVALGGRATLIGVIGHDDTGRRLQSLAEAQGVKTAFVIAERRTPLKVRALGGQQQLLRLDYEDDRPIDAGVRDAALAQVREAAAEASVVVVSDYAKGLVSEGFAQQLLDTSRHAGLATIVDPRPQNASAYVHCDFLTPNWKEAQALLGDVDQRPTDVAIDSVGRRLVERFGANVLLTLGAHGIRYFAREGAEGFDDPARAREVFDVSGAGDTVVAAFALALGAGADVRAAVRLANVAAGVVVGKVGTATVSRNELVRAVDADVRLVDREALWERVREARDGNRRVGLITGGFEGLHAASVEQLGELRSAVDVVIVGIRRPGRDLQGRIRMLLALRDVDLVHVVDDEAALLAAVAPDVHIDELTVTARRTE